MTKEEFYKNLKDELGIELTENQKESLLKFANFFILFMLNPLLFNPVYNIIFYKRIL